MAHDDVDRKVGDITRTYIQTVTRHVVWFTTLRLVVAAYNRTNSNVVVSMVNRNLNFYVPWSYPLCESQSGFYGSGAGSDDQVRAESECNQNTHHTQINWEAYNDVLKDSIASQCISATLLRDSTLESFFSITCKSKPENGIWHLMAYSTRNDNEKVPFWAFRHYL